MTPFSYVAITREGDAIAEKGREQNAAFLAGGTGLIDLMKLGVQTPSRILDIHRLPLTGIDEMPGGGLRIGALVSNTDLAYDTRVQQRYSFLSQAILSGASPQLRNMASVGGNLMQRTRCQYFRDVSAPCNKRVPGSGCSAIEGYNRSHAVLGTSAKCIAAHPSDMCVALAALDAMLILQGPAGQLRFRVGDFYVAYGDDPAKETILAPDEMIVAVELPALDFARRSTYVKVRDRASYEFALTSAAVALKIDGGRMMDSRVALGGVAARPWRSREAEAVLLGKPPVAEQFRFAAEAAFRGAVPQKDNAFKIELGKRTLVRALATAAALPLA